MLQTTSTHAPKPRKAGALDLHITEPRPGVYALTVLLGGVRFDALCHSTYDRQALDRRVDYITRRANAGVVAEDIAAEIAVMSAAAQVVNTAKVA